MKKQLLTIIAILIAGMTFAQSGFNYKALITDNGNALNNQTVDFRFTLLQNGNTSVYQETQTAATDANGIVSVNVGEGTVLSGNFSTINWENTYFLKVEIDTGNGYQDFGTSELKYVPYAKYAETAANTFSGDFNDLSNVPAGLSDGDDVNDADHDTTNELQTLSVSGNQLTISSGNTVTLPTGSGGDQWGSQVVQTDGSLNGDGTPANPLGVNTSSTAFSGWDKDVSDDVTELNDLSDVQISGNSIFIGSNAGINDDGTANRNLGVGNFSLNENTSGYDNTAIGYLALYHTTTGFGNVALGNFALKNNTTGEKNIGIGISSLERITDGESNIGIGSHALFYNINGNSNVAIGRAAGYINTGSGNIFLGYYAGYNETGDDKLYIANSGTSSPLIYGDFSSSELTVNGSLAVKDGSQGVGKIFTSDANGKGSWQDVSTWDTDSSDDFSGDYNDLSNKPDLFRVQGTTTPATGINDNIYHYGDFKIGLSFSSTGSGKSSLSVNRSLSSGNNDDAFGIVSNVRSFGSGKVYGIYNKVSGSGDGQHFGTRNFLSGDGAGLQAGVYNEISNTGDQFHFGVYNTLSGTGSGDKYGVYSKISETAGGNHYAVYGEATKDAPDVYAGYFVGEVNVNSGNLNVEDKLTAPDSGDTDMKAYIYGSITSGGTFTNNGAHSDGFTVSKTGTGVYEITFTNPPGNRNYTVIASMRYSDIGFISVSNNDTVFTIMTYNTSGTPANKAFNFVVYKK